MEFEDAVKIILLHEGGSHISRHPKDPGGVTKYGISKRAYPDLDIENLTEDDALEIYRRDYWDAIRLNEINPKLRLIVFDAAVNQGTTAAVAMLQACLGLTVDGLIGPKTIATANAKDELKLLETYAKARLVRYTVNSNWRVFGAGWARRLTDIIFKSIC